MFQSALPAFCFSAAHFSEHLMFHVGSICSTYSIGAPGAPHGACTHGAPMVCLVPTRHYFMRKNLAEPTVGASGSTYSTGVQEPEPVQLVSVVQFSKSVEAWS